MSINQRVIKMYVITSATILLLLLIGLSYTLIKINQIDKEVVKSDNSQYVIDTLGQQIAANCRATASNAGDCQ